MNESGDGDREPLLKTRESLCLHVCCCHRSWVSRDSADKRVANSNHHMIRTPRNDRSKTTLRQWGYLGLEEVPY